MDCVVAVTDDLGQTVSYSFDATGQLSTVTDPRSNVTTYLYDAMDRLQEIDYPSLGGSALKEQFQYNLAGDLTLYTDVASRERSFLYDDAGRLTQIDYTSDSTSVLLGYDDVNNLVRRQERNGDVCVWSRDVLNRVINATRTGDAWNYTYQYDASGNRTALLTPPPTGAAVYGTATYGSSTYARGAAVWSTPASPLDFDPMNRMRAFLDQGNNQTSFGYDGTDGRLTSISQPNGVVTTATYDLVGKLMALETVKDTTTLLSLAYDYNLSSDRLALNNDQGSYEYLLDASGRLIQESVNCFNEVDPQHVARGLLTRCQLAGNQVQLLALSDTFTGSNLDCDRWNVGIFQNSAPYSST